MPTVHSSSQPNKLSPDLRLPDKEKLEEILALAELGKNAKIAFHDLSNHITSLTLSLEHIANILRKQIEESVTPNNNAEFSPFKEINSILKGYSDRAVREEINIQLIRTETNSVKKSPSKEIKIIGSPAAFRHIIENIISNAFDSFDKSKKTTRLQNDLRQIKICISNDCRTENICISISDNGSGIPEKYQSKIFEENFTTKKQGHGIGLFLVKKMIVEKFNGSIQTKSSSSGSEFIVVLPAKKADNTKIIETS